MTDDRHYDLSITIVPGITAPRKLQLIANIDCPRRRNCPPPGVTHNASAPKICRGQPGAKTDSLCPVQRLSRGPVRYERRPCEHKRPIISQHCQFLCIFSRFLFFPIFFPFFPLFFFNIRGSIRASTRPPFNCVETKAIVPLGNNGDFLFIAKCPSDRLTFNIIKICPDTMFRVIHYLRV